MLRRFTGVLLFSIKAIAGCQTSVAPLVDDREQVLRILADLDNQSLTPEEHLENYTVDAVILPPDVVEERGHEAIRQHLAEASQGVQLDMKHEIVELTSFTDVVVVQGRVVGTAQPDGDPNAYPFETKNVLTFQRQADGGLKLWKVIFNGAPLSGE